MRDPYEILGVPRGAPLEAVRAAYRELCLRYHPDKHANAAEVLRGLAEEKFKQVKEAYDQILAGTDEVGTAAGDHARRGNASRSPPDAAPGAVHTPDGREARQSDKTSESDSIWRGFVKGWRDGREEIRADRRDDPPIFGPFIGATLLVALLLSVFAPIIGIPVLVLGVFLRFAVLAIPVESRPRIAASFLRLTVSALPLGVVAGLAGVLFVFGALLWGHRGSGGRVVVGVVMAGAVVLLGRSLLKRGTRGGRVEADTRSRSQRWFDRFVVFHRALGWLIVLLVIGGIIGVIVTLATL